MYQENFIPTEVKGLNICLRFFEVENPKANVLIVHGMCEHQGRYIDFVNYLNSLGYNVYSYDHRGHGKSLNRYKDYGYFEVLKEDGLVNDLNRVVDYIKHNSKLELFLFAHSMGTLVTRIFLQTHSLKVNKVILSGAPNYQGMARFGILLTKFISLFKGDKYQSKLITKLALGAFDKEVEVKNKNEWLSYNKDNVNTYNKDESCGFTFTNNGYISLFRMVLRLHKFKSAKDLNYKLPIYLIAGHDDPVIGKEKGFNDSINSLKKMGFKDISSKLIPNMRHEILNEKNKDVIYEEVKAFYDRSL